MADCIITGILHVDCSAKAADGTFPEFIVILTEHPPGEDKLIRVRCNDCGTIIDIFVADVT